MIILKLMKNERSVTWTQDIETWDVKTLLDATLELMWPDNLK